MPPTTVPAIASGRPGRLKASGASSTTTRLSIAPAANANDSGRRHVDLLHERVGDQRADGLRRTRQYRRPELLAWRESGCVHRYRHARPLRDVLQADREDHEQAEPLLIRREGGADREALRQAVEQQDGEDEHRAPDAGAAQPPDMDVARLEEAARDEQEGDAQTPARRPPFPRSRRPEPASAARRRTPRSSGPPSAPTARAAGSRRARRDAPPAGRRARWPRRSPSRPAPAPRPPRGAYSTRP